jgi:hypothetical protein
MKNLHKKTVVLLWRDDIISHFTLQDFLQLTPLQTTILVLK